MEETQIYSQRLHGITEKRRILSEVDRIQRELDQQRVKLQQLKRKSLRDRWLMDGLVPTAGVEAENPLSETEGHIKDLELQLESLQSELVYLENPQLKPLKVAKVQDITAHKELVNGERSLKQVDQNENLKEHPITEEGDQPRGSHGEKLTVSQKDPTSSTEKEGRPVPTPRSKNASVNHKAEHNPDVELSDSKEPDDKQTHPSQNVDGFVQKDADGSHNILKQENEIQNLGHSQELQDRKGEHQDPGGNPQVNLDEDTVDKVQSIPNQKLDSLGNTLEQEDQNLRSPTKELESVGQITDDSQDLNNDLFKPNENGTESLLDEITKLVNLGDQQRADQQNQDGGKPSADQQNQDGGKPSADQQNQDGGKPSADQQNQDGGNPSADQQNQDGGNPSADQQNRDGDKPSISKEPLNPDSQIHKSEDDGQNLGEGKFSVLISHEQGHAADEALALSLETERAHPVLLDIQEEAEKPVAVCTKFETPDGLNQGSILHFEDQTPDSASKPLENAQSSVLPPSDQEVCTTLPCKDQIPSQSLLSEGQVNQAQISQVIVVTPSGHEQRSSNSPQGPSASNQPGTRETSTAPESQPLLQKSQETDANHGANTAETRDKSTPTKKKTCQCCVVM
ncbi:paralemmin-3 isoform X2 [Rana temporaria]|uniref:paralemmin-3 isoform X2 n=1 Tax=Rana temporaria TaxID=8407 RepID=UPI001AAE0284|nr:paralemmin-3 isoform X2 [Rana temporaria]